MRRTIIRLRGIGVAFLLVPLISAGQVAASDDPPRTARYYRQQAAAAYKAKDYAAAIENFKKAAEIVPDHPTLIYNLACVYALAGRKNDALSSLAKVAEMGLVMPAETDGDLDSIKDTPEFKLILKRFEASKAPVIRSSTAFTIHEKGLITEGIVYDPVDETFFVSSVHRRKILLANKTGEAKAFASEHDGLFSVLGMSVDAKRRHLWVTSTAFPQMVNFKKEEDGISAVFKFDLRTNKLLKKYVLSNATKKHALGDLTIQSNGDEFTTDSLLPAVYVIRAQKDEIELFLEDPGLGSPQGLAFSNDERHLEVLEANNPVFLEPTLGVLVKSTFYFIANSQWQLVDENGKLAAEDRLRDPVVLKMNLDPR